jgi:hypothetical protein
MKTASGLVSEYLEGVSRDALSKYADVVKQYTRRREGIYALYKDDRLYYVGLATELRRRLDQHLKDKHSASWNRFSVYLTTGAEHLRELEALAIRIASPAGNRQRGKFGYALNLRRRLARDIKTLQRDEIQFIIGRKTKFASPVVKEPRRSKGTRLVALIKAPMKLRAIFKKRLFKASLRRDGTIRFAGQVYKSPSAAGGAVTGRATDGWRFWKCEIGPGRWVKLDELRR